MLSRKQKAIYLAAGGAAAASLVWLRYARSASNTRSFLSTAGAKLGHTVGAIQTALATTRKYVEGIGRIADELAQVGSEHKAKVETLVTDTMGRLEQTAMTIQRNLSQSSEEIAALIKDIRAAVKESVAPKTSEAA